MSQPGHNLPGALFYGGRLRPYAPHVSYQGVPEQLDTARINRLVHQFLAGAEWGSGLDSLESHDWTYRQLTAYCLRCLVDDYMGDSLTIEQVQETLNTYCWLNRFPADKRIIVNIPSATLRVIDRQGNTLLNSRARPLPRRPALRPSSPVWCCVPTGMCPTPLWSGSYYPKSGETRRLRWMP